MGRLGDGFAADSAKPQVNPIGVWHLSFRRCIALAFA